MNMITKHWRNMRNYHIYMKALKITKDVGAAEGAVMRYVSIKGKTL